MYKCGECRILAKSRRIFFKPKGWIKYKAPDGIVEHFCSEECKNKWVNG